MMVGRLAEAWRRLGDHQSGQTLIPDDVTHPEFITGYVHSRLSVVQEGRVQQCLPCA